MNANKKVKMREQKEVTESQCERSAILVENLMKGYGEWLESCSDESFLGLFTSFITRYLDFATRLTAYNEQSILVKVLMIKSVAFEAIIFYLGQVEKQKCEQITNGIYILGMFRGLFKAFIEFVLGRSQILADEIQLVTTKINQLKLSAKSATIITAKLMLDTKHEGNTTVDKALHSRINYSTVDYENELLDLELKQQIDQPAQIESIMPELRSIARYDLILISLVRGKFVARQ